MRKELKGMFGILGNRLAIVVDTADFDKVLTIRDELKELDLFDGFSFDITRMVYMIYLKTVTTDNYKGLYSLVETKGYRLVRYH
jgi:hypothetical protein